MTPKHRRPTPPGEILRDLLKPLGLSEAELAERCGLPVKHLFEIVTERRKVDADTAAMLSRALCTTPEFWINLQAACDGYDHDASEDDPEIAEEWAEEIARRLDDVDAGRAKLLTLEEFRAQLRAKR